MTVCGSSSGGEASGPMRERTGLFAGEDVLVPPALHVERQDR